MNAAPLSEAVWLHGRAAPGDLSLPARAKGLVLFVHGSGSSGPGGRSRRIADLLQQRGLATLLCDLLSREEADDRRRLVDTALLGWRVEAAIEWVDRHADLGSLRLGLFGSHHGAAAALLAAADRPDRVAAVVARAGRPDLVLDHLPLVRAPTLLIVGGLDEPRLRLNREALRHLRGCKRLEVVPGAGPLFDEPGTLDCVATHAASWFEVQFASRRPAT